MSMIVWVIASFLIVSLFTSGLMMYKRGADKREIDERSNIERAVAEVKRLFGTIRTRPTTIVVVLGAATAVIIPLFMEQAAVQNVGTLGILGYVLALQVAAGLFLYGLYRFLEHRTIKTTNVTSMDDKEEGVVELSGTAQALDEPLSSPLDDRPCVAYSVVVEQEWIDSLNRKRGWKLMFEEHKRQSFLIDDQSDRAFVRADRRPVFRSKLDMVTTFKSYEDLPEALQAELRGTVDLNEKGEIRVTARHIEHLESVYAFGKLQPSQEGPGQYELKAEPYTDQLIVSDRSERAVDIIGFSFPFLAMTTSIGMAPIIYYSYLKLLQLI